MSKRIPLLLAAALSLAVQATPAHAWWFEDDGTTWPVFDFHRYGGDVNRPAATPDRPYFHGDDAVPLGLRWRDLAEARAEAAEEDAAAAAAAASLRVQTVSRRRVTVLHKVHRRRIVHRAPPICVPATTAANR